MSRRATNTTESFIASLLVLGGSLGTWSACPDDSGRGETDAALQDAALADRGPDAAEADSAFPDAATADAQGTDGAAGCKPADPAPPIVGHAAGQDCLSCHDNMGQNLRFTLAGTAYDDATGTNPLAGATVTLVDDSGKVVDVHTGSNGNFYTLEPVTFPITVVLSRCPNLVEMPQPLTTRQGCNACHAAGNRIHLP